MQENLRTLAFPDLETAGSAACDIMIEEIEKALRALRDARIILAGGTTPRDAYKKLARRIIAEKLPVGRMRWFFGDERWVPQDHPRSNEAMAREALLDPIGAPEETVFSWRAGVGSTVECALRYAETVRRLMGREGSRPDILLMGMGADGHTASLFPDGVAHLPGGTERAVSPDLPGEAAAVYVPSAREWRLTLCPLFLRTARRTAFLVSGEDKSAALRRALQGDPASPASWVRGGKTLFLATQDALGREGSDAGGETRSA